MATIEIESYYDRVRAALAGLAPEMRDNLLEDLPDHLAEVLAEGDGSLRDRLGEPEAFADELRAAAGVEPAAVPSAHGVHRALERGLGRATDRVRRVDLQAGRLVGYPRLLDLHRALAPGWWVLRERRAVHLRNSRPLTLARLQSSHGRKPAGWAAVRDCGDRCLGLDRHTPTATPPAAALPTTEAKPTAKVSSTH